MGSVPRTRFSTALALLLLTAAAYSNSFRAGFALDNRALLLEDPRIREASGPNVALIFDHSYWWPAGEAGLYRPLTTLSFLFNYAILGDADRPGGYHWINLLLHSANVLLVFALGLRLLRSPPAAWFAAALWAVHPVLTESVTNIAGRADLLAGFGVLAGFWMYLRSTEGSHRILWLAGVALATTIGVFSKESAVALPGVIVLYELAWWKQRRAGRAMMLGILATLAPIAAMLHQRSVALAGTMTELPFTDNPIAHASFWAGRLTALNVIAKYLLLAIWPARLSSDYSYPAIPLATGRASDWIAWITVAVAIAGIALLYRAHRVAFFWASFAAVTFAPMANLLFPIGTIMAERFLYLPLIGLAMCFAMLAFAMPRRVAAAALTIVILGLAARTFARNNDWRDNRTIAEADVHTNSFKLHRLLAETLAESPGDLRRAVEEADRGVSLLGPLPDSDNAPDAYFVAGALHLQNGEPPRAIALLEKSIAIDHAYDRGAQVAKTEAEAYRLLSEAYLRSDHGAKALENARHALDLAPLRPAMFSQVAAAQLQQQQANEAAATLIAGMFLTSDMTLREQLMKLYAAGLDAERCAIAAGPNGPAINPACALVHANLCDAAVEMIHNRLRAGRRDLAAKHRETFVRQYGCPAGPLDEALLN